MPDYVANAFPNPADYSIATHVISQAWGVGVTLLWSGIVSLVAFKVIDLTIGLRVTGISVAGAADSLVGPPWGALSFVPIASVWGLSVMGVKGSDTPLTA